MSASSARALAPARRGLASSRRSVVAAAAPARPNLRVISARARSRWWIRVRRLRSAPGGGGAPDAARPAAAVRQREVKLKDNGNVTISAMTEEDRGRDEAHQDLFFKTRPQDFLAKDRLWAEQAERVYQASSTASPTLPTDS